GEPYLGRQSLLVIVPVELCKLADEGRAESRPGRRRRDDLRRQQLLDAGLARPRKAEGPQSDDARRLRGDPGTERSGGGGTGGAAAVAEHARLPVHRLGTGT